MRRTSRKCIGGMRMGTAEKDARERKAKLPAKKDEINVIGVR